MKIKSFLRLFIIIILLSLNIYLIKFRGSGDVNNWLNLIIKINTSPLKGIFPSCLNYDCGIFYPLTYPPGHLIVIYLIAKLIPPAIFGTLLSFKLSIYFFYIVGLFTIYLSYRIFSKKTQKHIDSATTVIIIYLGSIGLILNTQILGYTDIYFLPLLILSFLFLIKKRYFLSAFFFSFSSLIKWQPIIVFPLILTYLIIIKINSQSVIRFLLGLAFPVVLLSYLNPGILYSLKSSLIDGAAGNVFLSAGLNIPWIIGELFGNKFAGYLMIFPSEYRYIIISRNSDLFYLLVSFKLIFIFIYSLLLVRFIYELRNNTVNSLNIFLKYSSGVHENHLISALFICILYYLLFPIKKNLRLLIFLDLFNFSSMFIFYGFNGITVLPNGIFNLNPALLGSVIFSSLALYFSAGLITEKADGIKKLT